MVPSDQPRNCKLVWMDPETNLPLPPNSSTRLPSIKVAIILRNKEEEVGEVWFSSIVYDGCPNSPAFPLFYNAEIVNRFGFCWLRRTRRSGDKSSFFFFLITKNASLKFGVATAFTTFGYWKRDDKRRTTQRKGEGDTFHRIICGFKAFSHERGRNKMPSQEKRRRGFQILKAIWWSS